MKYVFCIIIGLILLSFLPFFVNAIIFLGNCVFELFEAIYYGFKSFTYFVIEEWKEMFKKMGVDFDAIKKNKH